MFFRVLPIAALAAATTLASAQQQLPAAPAPAPAELSGDVVDTHNGLVPGAVVVVTEVALSKKPEVAAEEKAKPMAVLATHAATADSAGHFIIRDLAPGTWQVQVTAPGFQGYKDPAVVLKPGEHHELEGVVLPIPTATADVTVTVTTEQIAEQELHAEEKQRALAIFPNFNTSYVWNAAPMNSSQKIRLSLRSTLDPVSFITAAGNSGYQYATNKYPEYGTGISGYAEYYGAAWGTVFISHNLSYAILPALFRQDPRYFYMGPNQPKKARVIHALLSSFLCRGDSGHTEFNVSQIGGHFAAGYISKAYHPGSDDSLSLAVDNTLLGIVGNAGVNLVREFALHRLSSGTPQFGTGKPANERPDPNP